MATYGSTLRRGLPRHPGGDAWPPAGDAPGGPVAGAAEASPNGQTEDAVAAGDLAAATPATTTPATAAPVDAPGPDVPAAPPVNVDAAPPVATAAAPVRIRRGLPRVAGGEPWPPAAPPAAAPAAAPRTEAPPVETPAAAPASPAATAPAASAVATPVAETTAPAVAVGAAGAIAVRRGMPRTAGGDPWPPADFVPRPATAAEAPVAPEESAVPEPAAPAATAAPVATAPRAPVAPETPTAPAPAAQPAAAASVAVATGPREPLPFRRTVWPGAAAQSRPAPTPEPARIGPFTRGQWAGVVLVGGAALLFAAAMVVFAVRWLLSLEFMQDFLVTYPGEYHLPEGAPVGFPAWLGWQHFFNMFFMVLIIRTGLQIRTEKRPTAFWSSKRDRKKKTSLTIWLHQSLDILWLVNGAIFLVLLFATGQWMRIVPTSWEVFPNALSAALQYVSLDWPTENGWVNYNSLQQLAYFATVFLAAPLAAITGYRMSLMWPKQATGLNKAYPIEWARAVHFPVMLYFVLFIIAHVTLVFATGALRNLNHMYAAQDAVNWVGFWIFAASMLVVVGGWIAARPLVVAPIARLFGNVVSR